MQKLWQPYRKIMATLSLSDSQTPTYGGAGIMTFTHISSRLAVTAKTNILLRPPSPPAMTPVIEASRRSSTLKNYPIWGL